MDVVNLVADSGTGVESKRVMWRNSSSLLVAAAAGLREKKFCPSTFYSHSFVCCPFFLPSLPLPCLWEWLSLPHCSCYFIWLHSFFLSVCLCNYKFHLSGGLTVYNLSFLFFAFFVILNTYSSRSDIVLVHHFGVCLVFSCTSSM